MIGCPRTLSLPIHQPVIAHLAPQCRPRNTQELTRPAPVPARDMQYPRNMVSLLEFKGGLKMSRLIWLFVLILFGCGRSASVDSPPEEESTKPPVASVSTPESTPSESAPQSESSPPQSPQSPQSSQEDKFDLELIFVPNHRLTSSQVDLFKKAALRWQGIITKGLTDMDYTPPWDSDKDHDWEGARSGRVVISGAVDDVKILVTTTDKFKDGAVGGLIQWRSENGLPILSQVVIAENILTSENENSGVLEKVVLHELAHALGFGTSWGDQVEDASQDAYFSGPLAIAAFDAVGGKNYKGKKVPIGSNGHWRGSVFGNELMASNADMTRPAPLSLITIQSMADIGYSVDVTKAERYVLPKLTFGGWRNSVTIYLAGAYLFPSSSLFSFLC